MWCSLPDTVALKLWNIQGVKIDVVLEILTKRIYAIYHLKEYECVNLGPSSKYRRQEAGSVKELDEILDDLNKKEQ